MRRQFLPVLSAIALAASLFAGATTASAGGSVPIPPPPPVQIDLDPYLPPNCEYVVSGEGGLFQAHTLECDLPPECEITPFEGRGGVVGFEVDCDVDPGCYLSYGEWNGTTYWYIDCWESECIGGCDPVQPLDIGLKGRS